MKTKSYFKYYGNTTVFYLWDKKTERYFKGTSVCRDNDQYDKEFGETLARAKAVYKMRAWKAAYFQELLDMIENGKEMEPEVKKHLKYFINKTQQSAELVNKLNEEAAEKTNK